MLLNYLINLINYSLKLSHSIDFNKKNLKKAYIKLICYKKLSNNKIADSPIALETHLLYNQESIKT
jgi:hypothetical protein